MMLGSKIISNNVYVDELSRAGKLEMPITTLFIGSYHRAIYILMKLDDEEEAIATKLWRVQFDDPETKAEFLYLWPDALCVDGCWWLVKDCITRGWLTRPIHDGSLFRPFPMQSVLGRTSSTSFFTA